MWKYLEEEEQKIDEKEIEWYNHDNELIQKEKKLKKKMNISFAIYIWKETIRFCLFNINMLCEKII